MTSLGTPVRRGKSLFAFAAAYFRLMATRQPAARNEIFLRAAYQALLKREPDAQGRAYFSQALERRTLSRWGVLSAIGRSPEYKQLHRLRFSPLEALHQTRVLLVRNYLPPADVIVDLGGAASGHEYGALHLMGYPHRPREITIVDLPPEHRLDGGPGAERSQTFLTPEGTHVSYLYASMTSLDTIPAGSADLVWSGQSIEHVTEAEADVVCREAYRILKPGGSFCFDTPNAALTRLQSPQAFIHPEHKVEYRVDELRAKIERAGFQLVDARGLCPMPESLRRRSFDLKELLDNARVGDQPEQSYLFYLQGVKPASR